MTSSKSALVARRPVDRSCTAALTSSSTLGGHDPDRNASSLEGARIQVRHGE